MQNRFIVWLLALLSCSFYQSAVAHPGTGVHAIHFKTELGVFTVALVIVLVFGICYQVNKKVNRIE